MKTNLKAARKASGLTQEEISAKLSVSQQSISYWERGLREPDLPTLLSLADIYEVSIDYLLCRVQKANSSKDVLNNSESYLIQKYRELSNQGQQYIKQQMSIALSIYKNDNHLSSLESGTIG